MNTEFMTMVEQELDRLRGQVAALEDAVTKIPQINRQADPSRPPGVVVTPAPLTGL